MLETARRLAISGALAAFVAFGCGGEKTEPAPAATPGEAPAPAAEAPAQPAPVEEVWSTTLPESFPPDVPRYPGAEVVKARVMEDGGFSVAFASTDPVDKVASYYNDSLAGEGWSTQRLDGPDGVLVFGDKGKRSASLGISTVEGKTQIDVLLIEMP